jgi:5'-methylthioadenosine phosphorylase
MKIGIIGGSGLEKGDIFENLQEIEIETPYGKPSSKIKKGNLGSSEIFIISRHGENHEITPTNVNNKANIYALGKLGCEFILATTAVGSLKENMAPGDFVVANQFIDFTKKRDTTFFNDFKNGIKHTSLAEPFSQELRNYLINSCEELNFKHHKIGTVVTIEGPRFSTRAESFMFKNFAHIINMSTAPEAILAKEAEINYAVIAMVTDYDCWKKTEEPVTWEQIEKIMKQNSENVKKVLIKTIEKISNKGNVNEDLELIKKSVRTVPNFPKQGIMFRDVTTLFGDSVAFEKVIKILEERYKNAEIDLIAGIESRGFVIGSILANRLCKGFVPIRKPGKLPYEKISQEYDLEYGTDRIEVHKDAIKPGQKVLVVDDLIATGGTAQAAAQLIEKLQGEVVGCAFIIDLPDLKGKEKLSKWPVFSVVEFGGE